MNIEQENLSFGRLLSSLRREQNMTLDDLFKITRVSKTVLELIEKEDHERLPATVLVKNFLRSYADAVGADRDEIVRLYLNSNKNAARNLRLEASPAEPGTKFWPRFLLAVSALAVIIGLTVFMMKKGADEPIAKTEPQAVSVEQSAAEEPQADLLNEPQTDLLNEQNPPEQKVIEAEAEEAPMVAAPEKLLLKIVSVEETWLKVIIDSHDSTEYTVKPGDSLEFEAFYNYSILIGNAAGVKLFLNDKPIKVSGSTGQVVKIQIP
jgi:cytoskeletal protein RodZ